MMRLVRLLIVAAAIAGAACSAPMPDQDRRIYAATPVAKLSVADLWKDFHDNAGQAEAKYVGKAVEVSGSMAVASPETVRPASLFFKQTADQGVQANLLDDEAGEILKNAGSGGRITLRCYCAGVSGNVILKSCVRASK